MTHARRKSSVSYGTNGQLPSLSALQESSTRTRTTWTKALFLPIPGVSTRHFRIPVPNVWPSRHTGVVRLGRKRGPLLVCFACMAVVLTVIMVSKNIERTEWGEQWPSGAATDPSTLVFRRQDLQRIWNWEISSGHYPSRQSSKHINIGRRLLPPIDLYGLLHSSETNWPKDTSCKPCNTTRTSGQRSFTLPTTTWRCGCRQGHRDSRNRL